MADGPPTRTLLLTPGPLTTHPHVRAAMDRDWGSRETDFLALTADIRTRLTRLAGVDATHTTIPIQGSGTFAVEAMLGSLVPRDGRLLVLANGAYGRRMAEIARRLGRLGRVLTWPEDRAVVPAEVATALRDDTTLTDVALVHSETTSGLVNPLAAVTDIVRAAGRRLLVDAMSSFGALPVPLGFTALAASANKGLEGVPGIAFVIADRDHLATCEGHAVSLSLDLHAQWTGFEQNGQWRFTPPVQVVAALAAALDRLDAETPAARHARYRANRDILIAGLRDAGFTPLLDHAIQGPVIVTVHRPDTLDFADFTRHLAARGVVIYPGKLTERPSFRVGCIGDVGPADMRRATAAIAAYSMAGVPAPQT